MLGNALLVGLGGFFGTVLRYLINLQTKSWPIGLPVGTLLVNVLGCFAVGVISGFSEKYAWGPSIAIHFVTIGIIGGFTTFSAFGFETIALVQTKSVSMAALNVFANLIHGFGAVLLGQALTKT